MHDIIIIGAGAAGLAAGQRLRAAGRDALIVEARDRVGGRIHTDRSHGPAELGAEFIHGDRAVTWEIVRAAGLRTAPWLGRRGFGQAGRILPPDDPADERANALYDLATNYDGPDRSTADLLRAAAEPGEPALTFALQWLANIEGADPERLSAKALSREHATSSNGEGNFHILDGYDRAVAQLAAGLEIRLKCAVERVAWGEEGVRLGLAGGEELRARRAIVTVPLGVLQAGRPIFEPELPEAKRRAIGAIAMGNVTKLLLWFERPIWPELMVLSTDGAVATWWPVESAAVPALMGYTGGPAARRRARLRRSSWRYASSRRCWASTRRRSAWAAGWPTGRATRGAWGLTAIARWAWAMRGLSWLRRWGRCTSRARRPSPAAILRRCMGRSRVAGGRPTR